MAVGGRGLLRRGRATTQERTALEWIAAWNSHNLDRIIGHYDDEVVFVPPKVIQLANLTGTIHGGAALRSYFAAGLWFYPDLRFDLVGVLAGVDGVTVVYENSFGSTAAETIGSATVGRRTATSAPPPTATPRTATVADPGATTESPGS